MDNARFRCCEQAIAIRDLAIWKRAVGGRGPARMPFGAATLCVRRSARHRARSGPFVSAACDPSTWAPHGSCARAWYGASARAWYGASAGRLMPPPCRRRMAHPCRHRGGLRVALPCTHRPPPSGHRSTPPRQPEMVVQNWCDLPSEGTPGGMNPAVSAAGGQPLTLGPARERLMRRMTRRSRSIAAR